MSTTTLIRDDVKLNLLDSGSGFPVVFQHGLGGDEAQVAGNFPDGPAYRRLTLECRAQGMSEPGNARPFSISMFAADILAACDARGINRFVAGGISMGAAIALHLAVYHPERIVGLVLARPAWLFDPAPTNMRPFSEVAAVLKTASSDMAREDFAESATARDLALVAPDNLASLLKFFDRSDPAITSDLLGGIANDGPNVARHQAAAINIPALVIGHEIDYVHPIAYARELASLIPGAKFVEIAPKATQKPLHVAQFRHALDTFLQHILASEEHPS
ncbi:alpha/beta fold hydrolase [Phyllobacterium zundukense]|uniref:Alpha/beta hydrolase n=1 Tax=Phyllobacterium zundukense TaxID=1867719 RepID=A0A2N9VX31_9HYPH|nr:alpha/beta hydrolase [Phyllobacterium zundukense]ATU90309.1 alpha/beta hydrolase [Phyllobacterium zundukense]PIO44049.1 alpha/beta hydrolase [Phyllobacterium zundukense]